MKLFFLILIAAATLLADGGVVVLSGTTRDTIITVFATPSPVRAGITDFSVLVQDKNDNPLLGAAVTLTFTNGPERLQAQLTHEQAVNKLLYASTVDLPHAGLWEVHAQCRTAAEMATIQGTLNVGAAEPSWITYWPYFAAVPLAIVLFAANQMLKQRRSQHRRTTIDG